MSEIEQDPKRYLRDCVHIEPLAIQEEYVRIPADMAYWGERYADAQRVFLTAKLELEEVEAKLSLTHRERLLGATGKATEGQVSAAVVTDPEMHQARLAMIEAEVQKVRLVGVSEAVRAKKDMLVSIGAHIRAELQGDPSIRSQARDVRTRQREEG